MLLCGMRGTYGAGLALVARLVTLSRPLHRGALGDIDLPFVWQAWHLRHWARSGGVSCPALPVAGMAPLGDIYVPGAWSLGAPRHFTQVWHLVTSTYLFFGTHGTYGE